MVSWNKFQSPISTMDNTTTDVTSICLATWYCAALSGHFAVCCNIIATNSDSLSISVNLCLQSGCGRGSLTAVQIVYETVGPIWYVMCIFVQIPSCYFLVGRLRASVPLGEHFAQFLKSKTTSMSATKPDTYFPLLVLRHCRTVIVSRCYGFQLELCHCRL